uniref:Uncharacterized protein n=1 Tax=Strongyloides papillosus TaxID=174720 RepID=A0A0N5CCK4_STREA
MKEIDISLGRNEEQSLDDVDSDILLRISRKKKGKSRPKKRKPKRRSSKNTTTTTTEVITTTSTVAPTTTSTKATTYNPNIFTWPHRRTDLGRFWCHCVYVAQKFRDSMKNFFTGRFFKQSGIRG